jgi:hypothetical protein
MGLLEELAVPPYPFWEASDLERVFGAPRERYLDITKDEARQICELLPDETRAVEELFATGAIVKNHLEGALLEGLKPSNVRDTTTALLQSFGVSHEIKEATVAVALHHWFGRARHALALSKGSEG